MVEKPMMHVPLTRAEVREMGNLPEHMREIARFAENVLPRAAEDLARMRTALAVRDRAWARLVVAEGALREEGGAMCPDCDEEGLAREADVASAKQALRDLGVDVDGLLPKAPEAE